MLCDYLATFSNEPAQVIFNKIDRVHGSGKIDHDSDKQRNTIANFLKFNDADFYVELCIKNKVKHPGNRIIIVFQDSAREIFRC